MRNAILICAAIVFLNLGAAAQAGQEREPSTAEERQRAVAIAHKLEVAPLDKSLYPEREWALKWVIDVPDVHVKLCPGVLGRFINAKYKYSSEILVQLTLSSAAFVLEHPDKAEDDVAQYTAGVEGVLKAYEAILKTNGKATSKDLDQLRQLQNQGKLADFVRQGSGPCNTKSGVRISAPAR